MNILLDGLPDHVEINGRRVRIETGYRAGIRFEGLVNGNGNSQEILGEALRLYFPGAHFDPSEHDAAVDAMLWFYRCGKDAPTEEEAAEAEALRGQERSFDFRHDAGYVYAAFVQAYGIDLTKNNIHWWQFRALFDSLPDDVQLVKIIGYRTAEIPKDATPEQRQRIEKLKRVYALPLDADQRQLMTDLDKLLLEGGDPSALLAAYGGQDYGIRRDP